MKDTFMVGAYKVLTLREKINKIKVSYPIMMVENFTFIDYFAIDSNPKGKGLGSKIFKIFLEMINKQVILSRTSKMNRVKDNHFYQEMVLF